MNGKMLGLFLIIVLVAWIVPYVVQKYKIKDDVKFKDTLPVGTAHFRGFLKVVGFFILGVVFLGLVLNGLRLLGL